MYPSYYVSVNFHFKGPKSPVVEKLNKKYELVLTRRAKVYSSSGSVGVV